MLFTKPLLGCDFGWPSHVSSSPFSFNSEIHSYFTRSGCLVRTPFARTSQSQSSVLYRGPKIWNNLIFLRKTSEYMAPFILWQIIFPFCWRKASPKHNGSMFQIRYCFLGLQLNYFILQTRGLVFIPKTYYYFWSYLTSSHAITSSLVWMCIFLYR